MLYFFAAMKPKDLKVAVTFEERRPLMCDGVFYVPRYYAFHHEYSFPTWEEIFGNNNPVAIEYCAGNGDWIVQKAQENVLMNWVAVEKRFDRVRKIWAKCKNRNLSNLLIVYGEGSTFTHHYVANHTVDEVYINFPDPWPKKRHDKHRLIKRYFLDELARVLKAGKHITFVTDDQNYLKETFSFFSAHPSFVLLNSTTEWPEYGSSWFERLWRERGREIQYTQWKLTSPALNKSS